MKLVYSSQDSAQIGLLSSVLDAANISFEIRNDINSQTQPGVNYWMQELWVVNDQDYEEARNLIVNDAV